MRFLNIYQSTCTHDAVLSWDPLNFSDPQSIDEIFSITIAASLREEGATLTGIHCWFPVPVLWIYKHLLSSHGYYNYNSWPIVLSCQHAKVVVVVMTTFLDKTVSAAWISSTEYNPKVTLGIRFSFLSFFLSFFFFSFAEVLKNRWSGDSARCCIQYMGFHVINWTLFIYECTLFFGYSGEKLPLAA